MMHKTLADKMIDSEIYQLFMYDRALPLFVIGYIVLFVLQLRSGTIKSTYWQFLLVVLGLVIAFVVQFRRLRNSKRLITVNTAQLFMLCLSLVSIIIPIVLFTRIQDGLTVDVWSLIQEQLLVASWETLSFGLTIPFVLLLIYKFVTTMILQRSKPVNYYFESFVYLFCILISTGGFAAAHIAVYGLDAQKLVYLFVFGFVFNFIAYSFSPTLAVGLHFTNNVMVYYQAVVSGY